MARQYGLCQPRGNLLAGKPAQMRGGGHGCHVLGTERPTEGRDDLMDRTVEPYTISPAHAAVAPCGVGNRPVIGRPVAHTTTRCGKELQPAAHATRLAHEVVIIGADKPRTAFGQMSQQPRLVVGHAPVAQTGHMPLPDIEHQPDVGPQHGTEFVHVLRLADARLHDPERLVACGFEHGERQPYLVVEIERIACRITPHAKHLRQKFLHGGLACRACDAHDAGLRPHAMQVGESTEGLHAVVDDHNGHVGGWALPVERVAFSDEDACALPHHIGGKIMSVETLTPDADEEVARRDLAAVGTHGGEGRVALRAEYRPCPEGLAHFVRCQLHPRISRMVCWSLKGSLRSPTC